MGVSFEVLEADFDSYRFEMLFAFYEFFIDFLAEFI